MHSLPMFSLTNKVATQRTPSGRLAKSEEIASAFHFLASDDAAHITGAILPVDGGITTG